MGKIVMPKNSALLNEIEAVLKIYYEENDWLSNDLYKDKLKAIIGDGQYSSSYTKKAQIPAYFGFVEWEEPTNNRSRKRITEQGKKFFDAISTQNNDEKYEVLMHSLENTTFGKNNCGVGDSDSDIEPPNVFIRASLDLNYLTYTEFAQILWDMSEKDIPYEKSVLNIKKCRILGSLSLDDGASNYTDAKPIMTLIRWGFLANIDGLANEELEVDTNNRSQKIGVPRNILDKFKQRLCDLRLYNTEETLFVSNGDIEAATNTKGENILIYGVPGCGKSHYIKERYTINDDNSERVVFHPDYTYSDFVGQILPKVKTAPITTSSMCENEVATYGTVPMMVAESPVAYEVNKTSIEYDFTPGSFTRLLKRCKEYSDRMHYLVIEEINRGNAPAIFGEIFQLLDRDNNGESEYGINNSDIADQVYGDPNKKVIIPSNLTVLATMNTADQNVFTLDTAFKRRWEMLSIRNNFKLSANDTDFNAQLESTLCGTKLTWMKFATTINSSIVEQSESNLSNEDKRLGHFFVKPYEMEDVNKFSEKIIMYLWNDVFKFEKDNAFNSDYKTLEDVLDAFQEPSIRFKVFADKLGFSEFIAIEDSQVEGDTDE